MIRTGILLFALLAMSMTTVAAPVELRGSPASMERQNRVAKDVGVTFVRTFDDIERLLEAGELVRLLGNKHYDLRDGLSSDAARPEVRLFVERLAKDYFENTGEKLVVTSLTRPTTAQPGNSHRLSIHPTGLALDLRISQRAESRQWIEQHLLWMEAEGLLDVTRERHPPHYHIALFPEAYTAHLKDIMGEEAFAAALAGEVLVEEEEVTVEEEEEAEGQVVRRSFWSRIAALFIR